MKKLGEEVEIGDIVELPKCETGIVLEITKEGIYVKNFDEAKRIQKSLWKKKKCSICGEKRCMMDLFKEESGRKYQCKICLNKEIRKEDG